MSINDFNVPGRFGERRYRIYWSTAVVNMEYFIKAKTTNGKVRITDASGLNVTLIGMTEENRKFTWNSKRAEYTGTGRVYVGVGSIGLRLTAETSGTRIKTSARPFSKKK
ncbi:DUF5626 family protein [Amphibacillus cookii]|uniref:DUF5626 family protein n=1 Tax=Amphibacillus cookii TaxID=767787 RepID=UPI001958E1BA|nr:DUF5626 family protein [Amphibacillus cookii]MBM7542054.1 hypothetical protein [Amphibacillus cookii]